MSRIDVGIEEYSYDSEIDYDPFYEERAFAKKIAAEFRIATWRGYGIETHPLTAEEKKIQNYVLDVFFSLDLEDPQNKAFYEVCLDIGKKIALFSHLEFQEETESSDDLFNQEYGLLREIKKFIKKNKKALGVAAGGALVSVTGGAVAPGWVTNSGAAGLAHGAAAKTPYTKKDNADRPIEPTPEVVTKPIYIPSPKEEVKTKVTPVEPTPNFQLPTFQDAFEKPPLAPPNLFGTLKEFSPPLSLQENNECVIPTAKLPDLSLKTQDQIYLAEKLFPTPTILQIKPFEMPENNSSAVKPENIEISGYPPAPSFTKVPPAEYSMVDFAKGVTSGLPRGIKDSAGDFVELGKSLIFHPVETRNQMYEGLQHLSELVGTNEWKAVGEALAPEAVELVEKWNELTPFEKGDKSSYLLAKYGTDILLPTSAVKAASHSIKVANKLKAAQVAFAHIKNPFITENLLLPAGSGAQIGTDAIQSVQKVIPLTEELALGVKKSPLLESPTGKVIKHFEGQPHLQASYDLHKKAQAFLDPHVGKFMPEIEVRKLIHEAGLPTFPKPKGIPDNFRVRITGKGGGMEYVHPDHTHTIIRVMPGKLHSEFSAHHKPYVIQKINSNTVNILGEIVSSDSLEAHILIEDFIYRG